VKIILTDHTGGFYLLPRHFAKLQLATKELFSAPRVALDLDEFMTELSKTVGVLGPHVRQRVRVIMILDARPDVHMR
jgi:hypothetical protein